MGKRGPFQQSCWGRGRGRWKSCSPLSCFSIGIYLRNKRMFAHAFSLLHPALHVEVKREKMGQEKRFTSQFDRELGGFREFHVTVREAFSKNVGFCSKSESIIFPLPGVRVLEDPLTQRQVSISRQVWWLTDTAQVLCLCCLG